MKMVKSLAVAACLTVVAFQSNVFADEWNKKTVITVSEPLQVPGKVLPAGKYVIKLLDSQSNRHIVQIFNQDESQIQATILAIPNYRLQPTGATQFGFYEMPAGQPKALRSWFYPGDNFGQEFAYPKNESTQIASVTQTPVPTTYAQADTDLSTARLGSVNQQGNEMELDRNSYSRADDAQPVQIAQNTPPVRTELQPSRAADVLPTTASPVPFIGLLGLLSLGASAAFRKAVRRNS